MELGTRAAQTSVISVGQEPESIKDSRQQDKQSLDPKKNRQANRLMFAFLILLGLLYALRIGPPVTYPAYGLDNSMYLVSAKALSEGQGYRLINHPDAPASNMFPIVYPAVLATALQFVSLDAVGITVIRGISALACLIFILLGYRLLRRYVQPLSAAVWMLLIGMQPWVLFWTGQIFAECLFAMWAGAAVLLATKSLTEESETDRRWWVGIAFAGVCAGLAMLTRTIGFTMIAGIGVAIAVNRRWRKLFAFAASSGLVVVPFLVWSKLSAPGGGSFNNYYEWVSNHFNLWKPIKSLGGMIMQDGPFVYFPPSGSPIIHALLDRAHLTWLFPALGWLAGLIFLAGLVALLKRRDVVAWCVITYVTIVIFYPWEGTFRFLMPIYPLLAIPLITGGKLIWQRRERFRIPARALSVSLVVLLTINGLASSLVNLLTIGNVYASGHLAGPKAAEKWKEMNVAFGWVKENVPENAIIVSVYAYGIYLFTDRMTISTLFTDRFNANQSETVTRIEDVIKEVSPDRPVFVFAVESYIGLENNEEIGIAPLQAFIAEYPERARLRYEKPEHKIMIYEIVQPTRADSGR